MNLRESLVKGQTGKQTPNHRELTRHTPETCFILEYTAPETLFFHNWGWTLRRMEGEVFVKKKLNALKRNNTTATHRKWREGERRGRQLKSVLSHLSNITAGYACVCVCDIVSSPFNKIGSCCSSALHWMMGWVDRLEDVTAGVWGWRAEQRGEFRLYRCVLLEGEEMYCREGDHLFGGLYGSRSCLENVLTLSAPRTSWGSSGNLTMWKSS